jgi:hypothetical protein
VCLRRNRNGLVLIFLLMFVAGVQTIFSVSDWLQLSGARNWFHSPGPNTTWLTITSRAAD